MSAASDDDLDPSVLAGLRAGDAGALESCYERFGGRVYRLCRVMLGQACDSEDATQEIFLKVLERAHQFEARARFTTWLHRLAIHHCLHRLEKESRRGGEALDEHLVDGARTPLEAAQGEEARTRVELLLAQLSPSLRATLALRELEGLSYAEIARVLAIPVGTVMSRLSRAREQLARRLSIESGERSLPPSCHAS